jgi:TPR repeat protein
MKIRIFVLTSIFFVCQIFARNPQSYEEYENSFFFGRRALTSEEKQRCQAAYQTYLQRLQWSERQQADLQTQNQKQDEARKTQIRQIRERAEAELQKFEADKQRDAEAKRQERRDQEMKRLRENNERQREIDEKHRDFVRKKVEEAEKCRSAGVEYLKTRDYAIAFKQFEKAVDLGIELTDAPAAHAHGDAFDIIKIAAEYQPVRGLAQARTLLADCYLGGLGCQPDIDKAEDLYRSAAESEIAGAQYGLGLIEGVNTKRGRFPQKYSYEGAARWLRKAADQGFAEAQFELGCYYMEGRGVAKDEKEAVSWFRKAVEQDLAVAQNLSGFCYLNGRGVAKDEREAASLFRKAADQGLAVAQWHLGNCYELGSGVVKDEKEAVSWYRKSADQKFTRAMDSLARCYLNATGVNEDKRKALQIYEAMLAVLDEKRGDGWFKEEISEVKKRILILRDDAMNGRMKNLKSKLAAAADSSMPTFDSTDPISSLTELYKSFESDKNQTVKSIKSAGKLTSEVGAGLLENSFWDDGSTLVSSFEQEKRDMVAAKLEDMTIEKGKQYKDEILKFMLQELQGLNLVQIAILRESVEEEYGSWRKYFDTRFRIYLQR